MITPSKDLRASEPKPWWNNWIGALLLMAVVVAAYWPAMHGEFLWDDDRYISNNEMLRSWSNWGDIWFKPHATGQYYPLTFSMFSLGYHLWGLNPLGFHLMTVLLHGAASVLLWQVLKRLEVRGAWLAGAIFALHPVNVMSVAWMTELKNTLSGSLMIGAAWAYLRFAGLGVYERLERSRGVWRFGVLAVVLFQLALFAKTAVSLLPVTLLLVVWWKRERIGWRDVWLLLVMLGLAVGMGQLTIYVEHLQGATGDEFKMSLLNRVLISGRSFWFYLGKLFFPYPLTFIYERWIVDARVWWQCLYPVATLVALAAPWLLRKRIGKGPFVAVLHFYIATSMLVIIQLLYMMRYSFVTDHWQYFGCLSIFALAAAGMDRAFDFIQKRNPLLKPAGCGLLLLVLCVLTWKQAGLYQSDLKLWQATVEQTPGSWMAQNIVGVDLEAVGRFEEAYPHFVEAQRLDPSQPQPYNNLGNFMLRAGRVEEAITNYQRAIKVNPAGFDGYYNMGVALERAGNLPEAFRFYNEALPRTRKQADVLNLLGFISVRTGKMDEAIQYFLTATRSEPRNARAYANLGNAMAAKGQTAEALGYYRQALQLNPDVAETHSNFANVLARTGNFEEAVVQYQKAIQLNPNYVTAYANLGNALLQSGKSAAAIEPLTQAVRLQPANLELRLSLARALAQAGQRQEARVQLKETLRLKPDYAPAKKLLGEISAEK